MMKILVIFSLLLIPGQYSLRINEIVFSPLEGGKDWIEFYNDADTDVDLKDYTFRDSSKGNEQRFPGIQIIPALTYIIIYPEDLPIVPFGLGGSDEFRLYKSGVKIHSTKWKEGDAPQGYSWAYCDGVFRGTSTITRSTANVCSETILVCPKDGTVEISEVKTKNLTGALDDYDWIEVWNPSPSQVVNLSCWTISDSSTGYVSRFHVPFGTLVQPHQYYIITLDNKVALGDSDEVHLFSGEEENNEEGEVDWKSYTNIDQSISRCISNLDGSVEWQATMISKNATNICDTAPISTIEISEIYAANGSEWVEFYNAGTYNQDVRNWRFSDIWKGGNRLPGKQQQLGISIPPGEYSVVDVGDKFSFSASGADGCRLYNPDGILVAFTSWTKTKPPQLGTSWSKCPNGNYNVTKNPTRGKANDCTLSGGSKLKIQISIVWFAVLWKVIF